MECALVAQLRDGPKWLYEIKLDGYRAIGVKSNGRITLFSRRGKSFNEQFPDIAAALSDLPDDTIMDGEVVALDSSGRPDFHLLQSFRSQAPRIHYFVFDLLCCQSRDLTRLPLIERRELTRSLLKLSSPRIHISEYIEASASDMLSVVREQGLEGIVAKHRDSLYEPGKRSGAWIKYRVNRGQEFVIGGYIPGPHGLDSLIVGYYRGEDLIYVARVRSGFVPASRRGRFREAPRARLSDLLIRQPAGKTSVALGRRSYRGQDEITTKARRKEPDMMLIGVNYHPSFQTIAFFVEETGEYDEQELNQ
jgi:ATP-dependent DNA ligase